VLESVQETHPNIRFLVVSMFAEDQYAIRCLKAGAHGYLNKAGDPEELVRAVRAISQGRKYVTAAVSEMLVENLSSSAPEKLHNLLSERELQTLMKIATGKRLSDIAEELMLSPKTVSVYRSRLLEKLKLNNNAELTVYAIRNEIV
jgi:DNA-binding NarL/FixJ family response regulator